mgnify:CR=1 FL=1
MSFYIHSDCRFYRGDVPCKPHKENGYHCQDCPAYEKVSKRILIIKLGAIGDVIRTTPLLTRYRSLYPGCYITWLTLTPAILPKGAIDEVLNFDLKNISLLFKNGADVLVAGNTVFSSKDPLQTIKELKTP